MLILLIPIVLHAFWDSIPSAPCNDENASLYTPVQMKYLAFASRGIWGDEPEAACWFRQSARAGNTFAYTSVGMTYEDGNGVEQDIGEAMDWYQRAIEAGHSGGAYRMALLYREGRGVPANAETAERYFELQRKLKETEPRQESESNASRKIKSMHRAIVHADRHLARIFSSVVGG